MKKFSKAFRLFNIFVGCSQNIIFGGIIYGWSSISGALLLAKPTDGGPGLTHDYVQVMFVTAVFFNFLGPLFLGIILDVYGPRACSVTSLFIITLGCALFSISNIPNLPLFAPAMSMIAFGGPGVQSAIVHLSNLFPGNKATATALITGSFQLSFFIFYIFDQLWFYYEINYQVMFLGYGCLSAINMLLSLMLYPDEPYHYEDDDVSLLYSSDSSIRSNFTNIEITNANGQRYATPVAKPAPEMMGLVRLPSRMIRLEKVAATAPKIKSCATATASSALLGSQMPTSKYDSSLHTFDSSMHKYDSSMHKYDSLTPRDRDGIASGGGRYEGSSGERRPSSRFSSSSGASSSGSGVSPTQVFGRNNSDPFSALAAKAKGDPSSSSGTLRNSSRIGALGGSVHGGVNVLDRSRRGVTAGEIASMVVPKVPVKELDLQGQLTSNTFIHLSIFFVITSFWANFMVGTIDIQLGDSKLLLTEYDQRLYGRYFSLIITSGALAIPLVGYVMDSYGFPVTWTVTVGFGVVWSLLLLYDSHWTLLPSFVCYALFRTFLFTFLFAYIADTMGFRYFGVLAGIMFVGGGLVGLLQYPLAKWATGTCHLATSSLSRIHCSRGNWTVVNMAMMISMLAMFWFAYRDWIRRRRHSQAVEAGTVLLRSTSKLVSISIADKMAGSANMSTRESEGEGLAASILPRSQSKSILFVNSPSGSLSSPSELESGRRRREYV